jgi:hypothetical protein
MPVAAGAAIVTLLLLVVMRFRSWIHEHPRLFEWF